MASELDHLWYPKFPRRLCIYLANLVEILYPDEVNKIIDECFCQSCFRQGEMNLEIYHVFGYLSMQCSNKENKRKRDIKIYNKGRKRMKKKDKKRER
jgi:hypothetical protein